MMSGLMRDEIGCGKFAGRTLTAVESGLDLAEEAGIEKYLPVRRAVERPHRRLCHAAASAIGRVAKQHDARPGIGLAGSLENLGPAIVDLAENTGDHVAHIVGGRPFFDSPGSTVGLVGRSLPAAAAGEDLGAADQDARVDAKGVSDQAEHDNGADAEPAAPDRKPDPATAHPATTVVATVIDVVAAAKIIVTHGPISSLQFAAAISPNRPKTAKFSCYI